MPERIFVIKSNPVYYEDGSLLFDNNYSLSEVPSVQYISVEELAIPLSIFSQDFTPLEAIVKYLKEQKSFSNKKISESILRDTKTIWSTYSRVKAKRLRIELDSDLVPLTVFNNSLSIFESLVLHLKSSGKSFADISRLIKRDERTIWTVHWRALKKTND